MYLLLAILPQMTVFLSVNLLGNNPWGNTAEFFRKTVALLGYCEIPARLIALLIELYNLRAAFM